jgi:hypothetical protein
MEADNMHEIPETLAQAQALADKLNEPLDTVIQGGLRNWAQQLLDEGVEGGYLTAIFTEQGLQIQDINNQPLLTETSLHAEALVDRFKTESHATLLLIQTKIRQLFDSGKLH